jgi:c(7)-type cytochrome triheme protein
MEGHAGTTRRKRRQAAATLGLAAVACLGLVAPGGARDVPLRLPAALVIASSEDSPAAVVFRHTTHAAYADNRCLTCHPQPFSILGRHDPITHDRMASGESCGICHNGRDATATDDACDTCHTGGGEP